MARKTSVAAGESNLRRVLAKQFGDDLFANTFKPIDHISTGIPGVDRALGTPGIACGRVTAIVGNPSNGKSTMLYQLFLETQKRGGIVVLLETEDAVELERLEELGIDTSPERLYILQPKTVEEAILLIEQTTIAIREEQPDVLALIAWDSVSSTPIASELEAEVVGKSNYGGHSKVLSAGFRRLIRTVSKNHVALVLVNQWKEKIGVPAFSDAKTMLGDRAVRFVCSQVIEVTRMANLSDGKPKSPPVGLDLQVRIVKNKLAAPFRKASVHLYFKDGFDIAQSWFDLGVASGIITRSGSVYALPGQEKKLLKSEAKAALMADVALRDTIWASGVEESTAIMDEDDLAS